MSQAPILDDVPGGRSMPLKRIAGLLYNRSMTDPADGRATQGLHLVAGPQHAGRRVDEVLAEALSIGRRAATRLIDRVRVNGRRTAKGQRVRAGDDVVVQAASVTASREIHLVLTTPDLLAVAKPAGLPSVALRGRETDSLAARIAARFPKCADVGRPGESGLVHRLDTGTSGLLLVARTPEAYDALRAQFRGHRVEKRYLALVEGRLRRAVSITAPIGQHRGSRRRMRALGPGYDAARYAARPAATEVMPVRCFGEATLVRATTRTGARHQVRVHLASIGHPLVNDAAYGEAELPDLPGYLLHAEALRWDDLGGAGERSLELPLPEHAQALLARLERGDAGARD
jgi:23S rRNA pseudouridine1911/1915/1917 synthase